MIALRGHGASKTDLEQCEGVFSKLYDIVFRIGHSETLYHRPGTERGSPEGKNFTTDFRLDGKKSGEIYEKFLRNKL